jgi:tetrapyrrole methylase family protein/MazG family protein
MKNGSLVVVGSGIKFLSHLTAETKAYIEQSDVVLYLMNDPLMKKWIQRSNPNTESLDNLYLKYRMRSDCYNAIRDYIIEVLRKANHVCAVFYGHPTVFSQVGLEAAQYARREGYDCKVLPAISAEDCLFAELLVDPSSCGCQSFEATDFLLHKRPFTPSSHLILWQVGIIGALTHTVCHDNNKGISILANYLESFYNSEHPIVIYEAAQYPSFNSKIEELKLKDLPRSKLSRISTLYVPPSVRMVYDEAMLNILNMDIRDLHSQRNS